MRIDPAFTVYPFAGITEPVSALSHLIGAVVFGVIGLWMIARAPRFARVWLALFTATAVFALSMSGVYHLLAFGTIAREEVFRRLDHEGIFLLIAGTATAAHGLLFRGFWRWGMIALLWIAVVIAVVLTAVFFHSIPALLSLSLYLAFGWLGALSGYEIWRYAGFRLINPLLAGGVAYTIGAIAQFSAQRLWVPGVFGAHAFFHFAVLTGLALHSVFFWRVIQRPCPVWKNAARATQEYPVNKDEDARTLLSPSQVQATIRRNVGVATQPNFEVLAIGEAHADIRLPYSDGMTRLGDTVSGPVLMTVADAAMYAAIIAHVPDGEYGVTSHMYVEFLRRPKASDVLARAHILRCGKRSVNCRVELFSQDYDTLVAHVSGAYSRMRSATSGA